MPSDPRSDRPNSLLISEPVPELTCAVPDTAGDGPGEGGGDRGVVVAGTWEALVGGAAVA